jgi:hypothetical protein
MASSPQDYIMDGHLKLEPGPVFEAKLAKKFINCGTLKTQASHKCTTTGNHIKCITAYGTGDKVLKFHCAVCDTSCKVASIKTHLGGEKHHKRWHVHLLPAATEAELTESYAVFCDLSGNRPYVSNRFHQAMSKKDPNYAAKRQRVSDGAVTVDATTDNDLDATTPVQPHNQQDNPTPHGNPTHMPTRASDTANGSVDGGLDDWVAEETEPINVTQSEINVTQPGQSDPVNVAKRAAAAEYAKNWTAARNAGPTGKRY